VSLLEPNQDEQQCEFAPILTDEENVVTRLPRD